MAVKKLSSKLCSFELSIQVFHKNIKLFPTLINNMISDGSCGTEE